MPAHADRLAVDYAHVYCVDPHDGAGLGDVDDLAVGHADLRAEAGEVHVRFIRRDEAGAADVADQDFVCVRHGVAPRSTASDHSWPGVGRRK